MLKFDEQKLMDSVNGALALRGQIEAIVDKIWADGFQNIFFLGIGGTYASGLQVVDYMLGASTLPVFLENAGEYLARGNKRLGPGSVVIFSSVTGSTEEMVAAVRAVKEAGATVFAFIDLEGTALGQYADYLVSYTLNEQLKFFMTAHRFMWNNGEFSEYDRLYAELDAHLARALADTEKRADPFAETFAQAHRDDPIHYFVGAGNQWGATYSYAMCYWEEQHWLRTKSIHAAEFFHGTLEIIDRGTNVTVFVGEDAQRPLSERVARFLPRVSANYTVIDTRDYPLEGISPEFRGHVSYLVMHAITNRIDVHMEHVNRHPMEIRRYYRRLSY